MQDICQATKELYPKLVNEAIRRTPKSRELYNQSVRVFPGGVTYRIRDFDPYPLFILRAHANRVVDVDGNVYTDYWMGHGALILGHANPSIVKTVSSQMEMGSHYGFEHPLAVKWGEVIKRNYKPVEMIRFTNSGTEANIYALRLARAYTGKRRVVKIKGGWHGSYNGLHVNVHPPFTGKPESPGILDEYGKYTLSVELNSIEEVRKVFKEYGDDVAAFVMEPVLGAGGGVPADKAFVEEVRRQCDRYGCVLVFDEVITGFRVGLNGGFGLLGVEPDLVVMGKVIGGGLPAGAFGGKSEIMRLLDHRSTANHVFQGGTFTGNPLTASAGIATIKTLEDNPDLYEKLGRLHSMLDKGLSEVSEDYSIDIHVTGTTGITGIHFTRKKPGNATEVFKERYCEPLYKLLNLFMRNKGVLYIGESVAHLLPSTQHDEDDVSRFIELVSEFFSLVSKA